MEYIVYKKRYYVGIYFSEKLFKVDFLSKVDFFLLADQATIIFYDNVVVG